MTKYFIHYHILDRPLGYSFSIKSLPCKHNTPSTIWYISPPQNISQGLKYYKVMFNV